MPKGIKYKKTPSRIAKRRKIRRNITLFFKISIPIALLIGLVFLSRADFLQIKGFEVSGTKTIQQENIKNTAQDFSSGTKLFLFPKSNIFILNKNKLAAALLSRFARLEKVEINKNFFTKKVELNISERKTDFLWCSMNNECFSMTDKGLIFERLEAQDQILQNKIIFRGSMEENPLMKNFTSAEKMYGYSNFIEILKNAGLSVESINIESAEKAVADTNAGEIIFDPEDTDLPLTAQNVIILINEVRTKNPSARFQYIDARFGNKFFYKLY